MAGNGERRDAIDRLSRTFERLATWSYDHRWIVAGLCLALLVVGLHGLSKLGFDNSFEAYFDRDDPVYAAYLRYREDFGSDEISYLMYEAPGREHGVFDLEVMRQIASLTEALESEVPFVAEVTSLSNVEYIEGGADGIRVYDLLEDFPATQAELLEVRRKVLAKPIYVGGIASAEGGLFGRLTLTAFGVIGLLLLIFFRSPVGVFGPLAVAALSVVLSLASIWVLGWQADILSSMVPTMVIAIGVAESVHIISDFRAKRLEVGDRREALLATMRDVGRAVFITSAALVCGFLVFLASSLDSQAQLGILLAFCISTALVAEFLLMPALILVLEPFGPEGARAALRKAA